MEMETKHLVALIVLLALGSGTLLLTLISQRARDLAFFFVVFGSVITNKMDVTFLGEYWYRGTVRGIEFSLVDVVAWCLIISTLVFPRYPRERWWWPASFGLMTLYFLYCCASVAESTPQLYGIWELTKVFRGLLIFLAAALFVRTRRELGLIVLALGVAVGIEAVNSVEQRIVKGVFRPPGTLFHENTLSTYMCTVGPVLLAAAMSEWSKWLRWFAGFACLLAAATELLTLSRIGIPVFFLMMGLTAVACTNWRITGRKLGIWCGIGAAIGVLLFASWDNLKARYEQATFADEFLDESRVETRGMYWRLAAAILEDHPWGIGLNNWSYYVSSTYGARIGHPYEDYDEAKWAVDKVDSADRNHAPPADTLPALTLGELGFAGFAVMMLIWLRWFQVGASFLWERLNAAPTHRLALGFLFGGLGIFLQSATEWTYRQTPLLFTFHLMMGSLASLYALKLAAKAEAKNPVPVELLPADEPIEVTAVPVEN
jgi:hypothetical protein